MGQAFAYAPGESRAFPASAPRLEIKLSPGLPDGVSVEGEFVGYASLFGLPDLGRDVVERGAFAASLARRGASGIRMLWQHDPAQPLGRWLSIEEDGRGLKVRGRLNLAVAKAREIHALMREGAIDGLSIGYKTQRARADPRNRSRRLLAVDLWEVSIVTFPMLPQARVLSLKRADGGSLAASIRRATRLLAGDVWRR